jgi:sigma-54 dependent transcriptional regulator, acetoin dehydrogenase operon transcriptional activator AcoR
MTDFINSNQSPSLAQIRQDFLMRGRVQQGVVNEAIERSWRRCVVKGVSEEAPIYSEVLTPHELKLRIDKNQLLLNHAEPEMLTLSEQIAHTNSVVILTDSDGVILRAMGESVGRQYNQDVFLPGVSWHEEHRGTNAIGTALVERAPISVQGAEHFMAYHHALNCSAVPIFSANNQVIATLDVSNNMQMPQQHTLALVKMAAQMVENRLFKASSQGEVCIHFHSRPEFIGTLWEGLALFSKDGVLQALNRSGQFQFNMALEASSIANRNIYFDHIFDINWQRFNDQFSMMDTALFPLKLQNGAPLYARISYLNEPVKQAPKVKIKRDSAASLDFLNSGDPKLNFAIKQIKHIINREIPILIQGETGAGKELFARAIHDASSRNEKPWIAVNCAALPEGLIEAELFGYEEGAYTGAKRKGNIGKIQQADGGTLFLDEIGDMPLSLQARLLRVLQERTVTPLGSSKSISVDFDLVSATNQNLKAKVAAGEFRSDLYYRINGLSVSLPSLRERTDLAQLINLISQVEQVSHLEISPQAMQILENHPWPGNIRQLHNVLRTAIALADDSPITINHFTKDFLDELESSGEKLFKTDTKGECNGNVKVTLKEMSDDQLRKAMLQHAGNISAVARQLGMSRNTLYRKLKSLGLM